MERSKSMRWMNPTFAVMPANAEMAVADKIQTKLSFSLNLFPLQYREHSLNLISMDQLMMISWAFFRSQYSANYVQFPVCVRGHVQPQE